MLNPRRVKHLFRNLFPAPIRPNAATLERYSNTNGGKAGSWAGHCRGHLVENRLRMNGSRNTARPVVQVSAGPAGGEQPLGDGCGDFFVDFVDGQVAFDEDDAVGFAGGDLAVL